MADKAGTSSPYTARHIVRDDGVASSNLATPTRQINDLGKTSLPQRIRTRTDTVDSGDVKRVFKALRAAYREHGDFPYLNFKALSERTGLERKRVRAACRTLAAQGYASYLGGLITDEGEFYGSGYAVAIEAIR